MQTNLVCFVISTYNKILHKATPAGHGTAPPTHIPVYSGVNLAGIWGVTHVRILTFWFREMGAGRRGYTHRWAVVCGGFAPQNKIDLLHHCPCQKDVEFPSEVVIC